MTMIEKPAGFRWDFGQRLRKKRGSEWQGSVVGFYITDLTPEGYAIASEREINNVQIYPAAALEEIGE